MNKILNVYVSNSEFNSQCGFKLSKCGNYLYTGITFGVDAPLFNLIVIFFLFFFFKVAKDGHLRVWNILNNKLVKTFLTPRPKSKHELYAAIPCFDLMDDLTMFYAVENVLSSYSI